MGGRVNILGTEFDCFDQKQAIVAITQLVANGGFHHVVTANAELVMAARRESRLKRVLQAAALVVADGVGVIWASRLLGRTRLPQRLPGVDLCPHLLGIAAECNWPVYLYGASPAVLATYLQRLGQDFPDLQLAGSQDGYVADRKQVAEDIAGSGARLLLVGLGVPGQEYFIAEHAQRWPQLVAMGVGGSFDVLSGHKARAPEWMQRLGLEWLYRLIREPQRYRRQLALPAFVFAVLRARFSNNGDRHGEV